MRILVVEDDRDTREGLQMLLREFGLDVRAASTLAEARAQLTAFDPDVCLTDLQLPDGDGLDLIRIARAEDAMREIVVLTGHGSLDSAVEAMKEGAFDYLDQAGQSHRLRSGFVGRHRAARRGGRRRRRAGSPRRAGRFGTWSAASPAMREMFAVSRAVAPTDATVLITGESGTGKELVAQRVHELPRAAGALRRDQLRRALGEPDRERALRPREAARSRAPTARRSGLLRARDGGTLFLDEVARDRRRTLQVKLLRVLETRLVPPRRRRARSSVDVRVVAATNRDLVERRAGGHASARTSTTG